MPEWFICLTDTCPEPRLLANTGLWMDMVCGIMIAATAWMRMKAFVGWGGPAVEDKKLLWVRRIGVILGAVLLAVGFYFQIHANKLQMAVG